MLLLYTHDSIIDARWQAALQGRRPYTRPQQGQDLVAALDAFGGVVAIVDMAAPGLTPLMIAQACVKHPNIRFVAAYSTMQPLDALGLFRAGLRGYCNRYVRADLLIELLRVVEAGEVWVGEQLMGQWLAAMQHSQSVEAIRDPRLDMLTEREQQVLPLVLEGQSNKRIAQALNITERTVKAHVSSILHKLDVRDRMQLALQLRHPARS